MDSIGAKLKKARLEKKFTIDEVYKRTKIHPDVLLAIEEDRFSQLSPVYLRGFLKIYSRFLGINPQEIIEEFKEPKPVVETVQLKDKEKEAEKVETVIKKEGPAFKFNFAIVKPYLKIAGLILAAIISLWLLLKIGKFVVTRVKAVAHAIATRPKKEAKPSEKKEKTQAKVAVKPVVKPIVKAEVKPIVKPVVSAKPVSSLVELSIRAKEDCYIYLKSDGKTVFQGVLKKGYAEAWAAKDKMELTVGNAGGIELNVNGNPIPPLGKRKQSIKNILITKEGLSIQ